MKTMTCRQLGGACDEKFQAETFEQIAQMSKEHGMEMFQKQDEAHLEAMNKIKDLTEDPEAMQKWVDERRREFEELPED